MKYSWNYYFRRFSQIENHSFENNRQWRVCNQLSILISNSYCHFRILINTENGHYFIPTHKFRILRHQRISTATFYRRESNRRFVNAREFSSNVTIHETRNYYETFSFPNIYKHCYNNRFLVCLWKKAETFPCAFTVKKR